MVTIARARELALSFPGAVEADHHGIPSFRVRGRIFATVPDATHMRVMAGEGEIRAAAAENPSACSEFWWGSRLACVEVSLELVEAETVWELLAEAWRRKAPRGSVRDFDAGWREGGG